MMSRCSNPVFVLTIPAIGSEKFRQRFTETGFFGDLGSIDSVAKSVAELDAMTKPSNVRNVKPAFIHADYSQASCFDRPHEDRGRRSGLFAWLVQRQIPVVHLFHENPVDCLMSQLIASTSSASFDEEFIVQRFAEIRASIALVRQRLKNANSIELKHEQLRNPNREFTKIAIHRLCRLTGVDPQPILSRLVPTVSATALASDENLQRLKMQLRPALTRQGFGDLFNLPKAA